MDSEKHLSYIQYRIDKVCDEAHELPQHERSMNFVHQMYLYNHAYVLACMNFGIISIPKYDEYMKYIEERTRGL